MSGSLCNFSAFKSNDQGHGQMMSSLLLLDEMKKLNTWKNFELHKNEEVIYEYIFLSNGSKRLVNEPLNHARRWSYDPQLISKLRQQRCELIAQLMLVYLEFLANPWRITICPSNSNVLFYFIAKVHIIYWIFNQTSVCSRFANNGVISLVYRSSMEADNWLKV